MMTLTKKKSRNAGTILAMEWALAQAEAQLKTLEDAAEKAEKALTDADSKLPVEQLAELERAFKVADMALQRESRELEELIAYRKADLAKQQARKVA